MKTTAIFHCKKALDILICRLWPGKWNCKRENQADLSGPDLCTDLTDPELFNLKSWQSRTDWWWMQHIFPNTEFPQFSPASSQTSIRAPLNLTTMYPIPYTLLVNQTYTPNHWEGIEKLGHFDVWEIWFGFKKWIGDGGGKVLKDLVQFPWSVSWHPSCWCRTSLVHAMYWKCSDLLEIKKWRDPGAEPDCRV